MQGILPGTPPTDQVPVGGALAADWTSANRIEMTVPQTSPYTIRRAVPADAPTLVEFNRALARETERIELDLSRVVPGVAAVLQDERRGRYFVACIGEEIVGQVMHTWEWSDWRNGHIWWLQSVYIAPEHRGRGVFRQLWGHLCELAAAEPDVVGLRLYVEDGNHAAQETYRRLGMDEAGYVVMERLFCPSPAPLPNGLP